MDTWDLDAAIGQFAELVRRALADRPQRVNCQGGKAVVVLGEEDYARLAPAQHLLDFLQASPLAAAVAAGELDLENVRSADTPRDVDLG
jgi:PHD/YefM family antitoxin component YafN of YafNO toxin-antitoxin module